MQALLQLEGTPRLTLLRPGTKPLAAHPRPLWLKLAALLCLLLVIAASTAQASHVHDEILHSTRNTPQRPAVPDHCPLCVAMHSASPAHIKTVQDPVLLARYVRPAPITTGHSSIRASELQTRPPPSL